MAQRAAGVNRSPLAELVHAGLTRLRSTGASGGLGAPCDQVLLTEILFFQRQTVADARVVVARHRERAALARLFAELEPAALPRADDVGRGTSTADQRNQEQPTRRQCEPFFGRRAAPSCTCWFQVAGA